MPFTTTFLTSTAAVAATVATVVMFIRDNSKRLSGERQKEIRELQAVALQRLQDYSPRITRYEDPQC